MTALATAIATKHKPRTTRAVTHGTCPDCSATIESRGGTVKCGGCGLVAPVGAFTNAVDSSKHTARAWTISGAVD